MNQPDAKLHFRISMVKSLLRILAGTALMISGNGIIIAGAILIFAEILGIVEEMV